MNDPYPGSQPPYLPPGPAAEPNPLPPPAFPYPPPPPADAFQAGGWPPPGGALPTQPYGQQLAPLLPAAPPKPSPMPDGPREYHQMLRGPRHRWWRPLLSLLLVVVVALPLMLLAYVPVIVAGFVAGVADPTRWAAREVLNTANLGPGGFLYVNLSLLTLIPATMLAIWIAHRVRPRFVSSVQGGIRWRWLLRCVLIVVPIWAVYLGLSALLETPTSPRPTEWVLLLVIAVCLTPFQAAAEEYFFRGWIMQSIGSWFKHPLTGLLVTGTISVATFSAAHGSPDIWVVGSLGVFSLTACIAAWRTGGLEAGIAIHAVNNVGVLCTVIVLGGWQEAFVSANSQSTPMVFGIAVGVHGVALALILWQAKMVGIARHFRPAAVPSRGF